MLDRYSRQLPGLSYINTAIQGLQNSKQDNVEFDGVYNKTTNKAATVKTVTDKIAEVVADAPESYNTLAEIAAWIEAHPESVAEINQRISENAGNIAKNTADIRTNAQNIAKLETDYSSFKINDFSPLYNKANKNTQNIESNTTDIANIVAGDKVVKKVIVGEVEGDETVYGTNSIHVNRRNHLIFPNRIGTIALEEDIQKLKDGTDYVALATKSHMDGVNNVIHQTYETKTDAQSKYNTFVDLSTTQTIGGDKTFAFPIGVSYDANGTTYYSGDRIYLQNQRYELKLPEKTGTLAIDEDIQTLTEAIAETMSKVVRVL